MMVIGLTGGIASGKSTVATMLRKANIPVVDADELAHFLTKASSPLVHTLAHLFGDDIIAPDGSLHRKNLARIVFDDADARAKLEAVMHPAIRDLARQQLKELADRGHQIAVYMAPLIFENNLHNDFYKTILVVTDRAIALTRATARDNASAENIEKRMNAQMPTEKKIELADAVINNNGSLDDLHDQLESVWTAITGTVLTTKIN